MTRQRSGAMLALLAVLVLGSAGLEDLTFSAPAADAAPSPLPHTPAVSAPAAGTADGYPNFALLVSVDGIPALVIITDTVGRHLVIPADECVQSKDCSEIVLTLHKQGQTDSIDLREAGNGGTKI